MRSSNQGNISFDLGKNIRIFPSDWPHPRFKVKPGDFSKFVPYGNDCYGYQSPNGEGLLKDGPSMDAHGGAVYFDGHIEKEDFRALLRVMGIRYENFPGFPILDYAVFVLESEQPVRDGYLRQVRVVSKSSLHFYFKVLTDTQSEKFPKQDVTIDTVLWSFIEAERARWVDLVVPELMEKWHDMAYSMLGFGFMQENASDGVCRIWSRPWLLTK